MKEVQRALGDATKDSDLPRRGQTSRLKAMELTLSKGKQIEDVLCFTQLMSSSGSTRNRDPSKHVFHVVTDKLNYAAMKMCFLANPPGKATIHMQNVQELTWLNSSYRPVLRQLVSPFMINYHFRSRRGEFDSNLKYRNPKYLLIMNHLRFYLPEIFPKLDKVLFLDDDSVVQKDLSGLWSLDLMGKVIGVVETCGESSHRFDRYLNFSNPLVWTNFNPHACGWAFGMNIFDLDEWRKLNIMEVYHKWQNLIRGHPDFRENSGIRHEVPYMPRKWPKKGLIIPQLFYFNRSLVLLMCLQVSYCDHIHCGRGYLVSNNQRLYKKINHTWISSSTARPMMITVYEGEYVGMPGGSWRRRRSALVAAEADVSHFCVSANLKRY
ncbi:hypothetical protein OROMI_022626 [Orobanche minor]